MARSYSPISALVSEALYILESARVQGIPLRLLGGLAIHLQCPSTQADKRLQRPYSDLDFVTLSRWNTRVKALFSDLGYVGNKTFNDLNGHRRLLFSDESRGRKIDIFLDSLQMCHPLDFRSRLDLDQRTLSVTDLLLTKLQIVELNEKDIVDAIGLLTDHMVGESESGINVRYIKNLMAYDWGLYKTCKVNIQKIQRFLMESTFPFLCTTRLEQIESALEAGPKSLRWKMRAAIGERVRWYEMPEELG